MGAPKRVRIDPTDDRRQLRLRVQFPERETYELLRPIVLFGQTAAERAQFTGVSERTLDRKADRFDAEGMTSLFPNPARGDDDRRRVPADPRHRILALKAEYPSFRPHEIAAICRRRDDRRVSHKTVQRILIEEPLPSLPKRRYPPYAQIPDGARRRTPSHGFLYTGGSHRWPISQLEFGAFGRFYDDYGPSVCLKRCEKSEQPHLAVRRRP